MEKLSSYSINISVDTLRNGFKLGKVPDPLHEPFQSLLPRLTGAAATSPAAVYLFSGDDIAEVRNLFGYSLAAALTQHIPSTLLVDCGYLDVGMNGIVPERDALGFLDLLLYGSSLGVITQETSGGVRVVGAGSFPVTKKMPFVLNAFEPASRRLVAHSGCAIYCGPLFDDDGGLHPLVGAVDIPILVRTVEAGAGVVDPIEEQITAQCDAELLSIRITPRDAAEERAAPHKPSPAASAEPELMPPVGAEPEFEEIDRSPSVTQRLETPGVPPVPPAADTRPAREAAPRDRAEKSPPPERPPSVEYDEEFSAVGHQDKKHASLIPKIATAVVVLVAVAFLVWWFNAERRNGGDAESGRIAVSSGEQSDSAPAPAGGPETVLAADTTAAVSAPDTTPVAPEPTPVSAPGTSGSAGAEVAESVRPTDASAMLDSDNILVMDDLESNWGGYYLIHVSSFRESSKARTEVAYLSDRGYPAFVVYIDLGPKGKWYRVYTGPLERREQAREMKKNLDDTPGVRFTRITQIPR
jgi:cell division septation protein DedD